MFRPSIKLLRNSKMKFELVEAKLKMRSSLVRKNLIKVFALFVISIATEKTINFLYRSKLKSFKV